MKEFLKEAKLPTRARSLRVRSARAHRRADGVPVQQLPDEVHRSVPVQGQLPELPDRFGSLIDLDCAEDFIRNLLQNVRGLPHRAAGGQVEKRNRLRVPLPWLEARVAEGNQGPYLHNGIVMIYIDTHRDPEQFLKTNAFYDSASVGKYCEEDRPEQRGGEV